jgi:hypothetical protein
MGIAATVTFFISRWRPAPWGTTHDIGRDLGKSRYGTVIRSLMGSSPWDTTQNIPRSAIWESRLR